MKHLALIIGELYPNRMFTLKEVYDRDEVFNICVEWQVRIEDVCNESFSTFPKCEEFVHKLYESEMSLSKRIKGKNE